MSTCYNKDMTDDEFDELIIESVYLEFPSGTLPTTGGLMFGPVRMGDLEKEVIKRIHNSELMGK